MKNISILQALYTAQGASLKGSGFYYACTLDIRGCIWPRKRVALCNV